MENDKTILNSLEELNYEKPQFLELSASFAFGLNNESGGRNDGGDQPGSMAGEEEGYDDSY